MIQSGTRVPVTDELRDANGIAVDTDAHLHVQVSGKQVLILRRADAEVVYANGVYRAEPLLRVTRSSKVTFRWHYPEIDFWSDPVSDWIEGPEPTEVVG